MSYDDSLEECQHEHVFERLAKRYVQPGADVHVGAADGEYCISDLRYFGSLKNSRHVITHFFADFLLLDSASLLSSGRLFGGVSWNVCTLALSK
ncbi:Oidioi.mRNA.OKI2018_I69.XSR.g13769.t1.cds [Oikopleura dioica]|uniref:Oidioi.mRNA.OKI2018_I69.XSR.g13769.t1.cds n=1 Tax=Oikopleura dioica TaxID=34765 RepID=A0ABN7S8B4_OIKDI|nr:Oidioi.mRNA.OKI2018_I69.XSR.g13769.t1.cds [Oikopleura dioica]